MDLSTGYFTQSQRIEKLCYGSKHELHILNKVYLSGRQLQGIWYTIIIHLLEPK